MYNNDSFFSFIAYMTVIFFLIGCFVLGVVCGVSYGIYCLVDWVLQMVSG